ncbi:MAG: HEAT repeat domain-containing protein [Candidatus Helarchaeota archaeon]|nr:HEAT repeat domain-containing protein [Candidatus Helarchaeota archaeon]
MSNFETLIKNLESSDIDARINAIEELGELGDPRAIDSLSKLLNDPIEQIRDCAIWNLGLLKAGDVLIGNLNHKLDSVRKYVIEVLGNIEEQAAVDPLIELLKDPNDEIRANSAWSLGKLENKKAFEPLLKSLNDECSEVRENSAWALGKLNDIRAIPFLLKAIYDPDEIVQNNAKESIEKIYQFLEDQELSKKRSGVIYECPAVNEFCKQEKKNIKKYSDKNVIIEIKINENCKLGKICIVNLI